jgi:hypothetical protein
MLFRIFLHALLWPVLLVSIAWGCAALWFDGPASRPVAGSLAAGFAVAALILLVRFRPLSKGVAAYGVLFLLVLGWWLTIPPSNERDWQRDVTELPTATIDGDLVTIRNVRNFEYRSTEDYSERWETRTYDLSRIVGVDIYFFYWGSPWIAHTVMSWNFEDGPPLAISIETRKERGESYSSALGFFRQYELYYVVADELDVILLRTNYRNDHGYLFRMSFSPDTARKFLLAYFDEMNRIARKPKWYNAFTHNCTTSIRIHAQEIGVARAWNWRHLANGKGPELLYMRGMIDTSLPFEELKARSYVNERANAAGAVPDFSRRIREGLPPRPSRR